MWTAEIQKWTRKERNRRCAEVFARQFGLISRAQALAAGLTDGSIQSRLEAEVWETLIPTVYRLVGVPSFWLQEQKAAELWAGRGAGGSHRAAAAHWGLEGNPIGIIELTLPRKTVSPDPRFVIHFSQRLSDQDLVEHGGLLITTVPRTLVDLGAVQRRWRVQAALDHALRAGMTSEAELRSHLSRLGGRGCRGAGVLQSLLKGVGEGVVALHSPLERRVLTMLRAGRIPEPVRQHQMFDEKGLIGRLDFAWPELRVGVEVDGFDPHMSRDSFRSDRTKMNRAARIGWTLLHATWDDVRRPEALVETILSFFP